MNIFDLAKEVKGETDDIDNKRKLLELELDKKIDKIPLFKINKKSERIHGYFYREVGNDDELKFVLHLHIKERDFDSYNSEWKIRDSIIFNTTEIKRLRDYLNKLDI